jgi:hypothetical protein
VFFSPLRQKRSTKSPETARTNHFASCGFVDRLSVERQYSEQDAAGPYRWEQIIMSSSDTKREMLRHTVATLAYRGAKAVRGAPDSFASYRASETARTPAEILAHIGDLLDWGLSIARGAETWNNSDPLPWDQEVARFHRALESFDSYLSSEAELSAPCERLFQGPVADALTHVGQLTILRRIAGTPIKGENYSRAKIESGRLGSEQAAPKREFD